MQVSVCVCVCVFAGECLFACTRLCLLVCSGVQVYMHVHECVRYVYVDVDVHVRG